MNAKLQTKEVMEKDNELKTLMKEADRDKAEIQKKFNHEKTEMVKEFEDLIVEEETKLKEIKSSIEMKRQVKEAKRVWEKKFDQAKFLSARLDKELKEVKFKNMLEMAKQTEHI